MTDEHSYQEGVRDGRIEHLEKVVVDLAKNHADVRDNHATRLNYLEKIAASMLAIVAFTTIIPKLLEFIERVNP